MAQSTQLLVTDRDTDFETRLNMAGLVQVVFCLRFP